MFHVRHHHILLSCMGKLGIWLVRQGRFRRLRLFFRLCWRMQVQTIHLCIGSFQRWYRIFLGHHHHILLSCMGKLGTLSILLGQGLQRVLVYIQKLQWLYWQSKNHQTIRSCRHRLRFVCYSLLGLVHRILLSCMGKLDIWSFLRFRMSV